MIIDVTGTELIPGNEGNDCPGSGKDSECCCDECDYMMCCLPTHTAEECKTCKDLKCPRTKAT